MKKTLINFALVCACSPFLIQCASQADIDDLRYQLRIVNKKLEDMKSTTVGQLQKRQAASSGKMDQLEREILELQSQLEETSHINRRLREHNKELEESISTVAMTEEAKRAELLKAIEEKQKEKERRLNELNEQIRIQNEHLKAIQQARIRDAELKAQAAARAAAAARAKALAASNAGLRKSRGKHILAEKRKVKYTVPVTSRKKNSSQSVKKKTPTGSLAKTPPDNKVKQVKTAVDNSFATAMNLYNNNKFSKACSAFERIAENGPVQQRVESRFMLGECLLKQKEYDKAIMQYQKIISQNSNHAKAPAAMLKQALVFEKISDKTTAKVIYKKILKEYGSSPEAESARKRLGKL
jgi:tol-pal system protein YbgF